jgi:hypothetical protein
LSFENNVLSAMRFHSLGDLFWDRVETPAMPTYVAGQIAAHPRGDAVSIDGYTITVDPAIVGNQAHDLLDKIARLDEVTPGEFTYTLNVQAAHAAFEEGNILDDILADWERVLRVSVPAQIRDQLTVWWRAYGQVRIYQDVTVVEFEDDLALSEMKAVTSLSKYLIAEVSPRLILISRDAVDPLIVELQRAGYTPKYTDGV